MTLGRRGREPRDRPQLEDPRWSFVEVEELTPQRVVPPTGRRPSMKPAVAIVPVIALLALGLGAFGGRVGPRSADAPGVSASAGALTSSVPISPGISLAPPIATPVVPCGNSTELAPEAFLSVDGVEIPPRFDEIDIGGSEETLSTPPDYGEIPDDTYVDVRSDSQAWLGIAGEACALGWSIALAGESQLIPLGRVTNPARDPLEAQQNRFDLRLAQFRGARYLLLARFSYAQNGRQGVWPIRILPFDLPAPELHTAHRPADVVPGCDVQLDLANGYSERVAPCSDAVAVPPSPVIVKPGTSFTFGFGDGWSVQFGQVLCGRLDGVAFVTTFTDACVARGQSTAKAWTFDATEVDGSSTLAISACALQFSDLGSNEVCGTWYATIEVQG